MKVIVSLLRGNYFIRLAVDFVLPFMMYSLLYYYMQNAVIILIICVCYRVAGHPLAQNERCLHMFLLEPVIDKNYVPGKVRIA